MDDINVCGTTFVDKAYAYPLVSTAHSTKKSCTGGTTRGATSILLLVLNTCQVKLIAMRDRIMSITILGVGAMGSTDSPPILTQSLSPCVPTPPFSPTRESSLSFYSLPFSVFLLPLFSTTPTLLPRPMGSNGTVVLLVNFGSLTIFVLQTKQ